MHLTYYLILIQCLKEPQINLAIFTLHDSSRTSGARSGYLSHSLLPFYDIKSLTLSRGRIDFIQNMEYKYVELLFCPCVRSPMEVVQRHITDRYNAVKQQLAAAQTRLSDISNLVNQYCFFFLSVIILNVSFAVVPVEGEAEESIAATPAAEKP